MLEMRGYIYRCRFIFLRFSFFCIEVIYVRGRRVWAWRDIGFLDRIGFFFVVVFNLF